MNELTQEQMEKMHWEADSQDSNIWRCLDTNKFHFENEAEMLDTTPYDSFEDCRAALVAYAKQL